MEGKFKQGDKIVLREKFGGIVIGAVRSTKGPEYRVLVNAGSVLDRATRLPDGDGELKDPLNADLRFLGERESEITVYFVFEKELRFLEDGE